MAFTSDRRFICTGDSGTLVFNVGLKPEYHVTKEKPYPMVVTDAKHSLTIEYVNDIGEKALTTYDRNDARDGYESIMVNVADDEFETRVNSLRESHAETIHSIYTADINSWNTYCDGVIEKAKEPI